MSDDSRNPLSDPIFRRISRLADAMGVRAYVVGGYVRDYYLGRPSTDIDVVVVGSGIAVAEALAAELHTRLSVFKTFGTGMLRTGGVEENYPAMKNYQIAQGRGLQYMDMKDNKHVCVIGDYLNRVAFGGNGLGQTLKIGANKFRIVGVLAAKVSDPDMQQGSDDDCVYLPSTTAMRLSSQSTVNNYAAVMEDESRANEAKSAVESELQRLLGSDNGYYVYSASEWLEEMNNMINMVIVILTGIASISLLVGGIGIMNIMLVSVTERTREIGIRKALGAKERTILSQFVVEAATTSALGGALGIALGYIVSMGANKVLPMFTSGTTVTVSPSFNSIAVAFGISVGIGVLFGYLPAKRAARLNPIEALRYD